MCPAFKRTTEVNVTTSQLDMADGDTLEVHQEQIGGGI